jgi:hypothetical protein
MSGIEWLQKHHGCDKESQAAPSIAAKEAAGGDASTAEALRLLQGGLRDLDPAIIPTAWV